MWNFGSLLGVTLISQIVRGLWLAAHYNCDTSVAFYRVDFIMRETSIGWFMRALHRNGARMFFVFLYLHIARGLYYRSFTLFTSRLFNFKQQPLSWLFRSSNFRLILTRYIRSLNSFSYINTSLFSTHFIMRGLSVIPLFIILRLIL